MTALNTPKPKMSAQETARSLDCLRERERKKDADFQNLYIMVVSIHSWKPMSTLSNLSEVSPVLPFKQFQHWSDRWRSFLILPGRLSNTSSSHAPLSSGWTMLWCPCLWAHRYQCLSETYCLCSLSAADMHNGSGRPPVDSHTLKYSVLEGTPPK